MRNCYKRVRRKFKKVWIKIGLCLKDMECENCEKNKRWARYRSFD